MKYGNIIFQPWIQRSFNEWSCFEDHFYSSIGVGIYKIYSRFSTGYAWYPEFHGDIEFMNDIYAKSTNYKEFNKEKEAIQYVEEFIARLHKLKVFA